MNAAERRARVRHVLAGSLRGRRRQFAELGAWSIVQALPTYLSGRLVARAIDRGFLVHRTGTGFAWLALFGASIAAGAWGTRQTLRRLAAVVEPFRDDLVGSAVRGALRRSTVPGASADTASVARVATHVEIVREAYASVLMVVQSFAITTLSALLGLSTLAPAALPLVLVPLLAGLVMFAVVLARMAARQRASIMTGERIAETATSLARGLRDVVASGGEGTARGMVGRPIDAQARATSDLARLTGLRTVAVAIASWVPVILVLVRGPSLVRHGATTGVILGTLTYLLQGIHPALQTVARQLGGAGLWLLVTLGRVVEMTGDGEEDASGAAPSAAGTVEPCGGGAAPGAAGTVESGGRGHGVRVDDVTFRYGPWADPVIRHLTLDIAQGEHLAVVGPSGIGKSTLAGLIAGLLRPEAGAVRIGGVAVSTIGAASLARRRVLIPQEAYVFTGTVADNLIYLNPGATVAEIDDAVDRLAIRALIDRLGGYRADLDAAALSAGERQLITLARSYLSAAPIVILDEATCHLDPTTEARVEHAFAARPGTLVVIAHRISSALRAQRILIMDGTHTALGTHDELLARSDLYRDLVGHWLQHT